MASTTTSTSLAVTLAQAISYLTRSLTSRYSATTIIKLQLCLEQNLTAQFAPSWVPSEPLRGSGRRCLTLSPHTLPPRAIYNACQTAGVEWTHWIALLGGVEFDLFIDPGSVSARFGNWDTGKVTRNLTIWSDCAPRKPQRSEQQLQAQLRAQAQSRSTLPPSPPKTYAQQLIEGDEDEEIFAMIADEVREPTWLTPTASDFNMATPMRSQNSSPVSAISTLSRHSRSSSRSSNSSSGFSIFSHDSADSYSSGTTVSSPDDDKPSFKLSRRERARQARVFIDPSKTAVTNYDGGKTTVLTGGVMLGGGPSSHKKTPSSSSASWRSIRV